MIPDEVRNIVREARERAEAPQSLGWGITHYRADIPALCDAVDALLEDVDHWRIKAKCYGGIVHGCTPALEAAGIKVDASGEGGAVAGIKAAVEVLSGKLATALAENERLLYTSDKQTVAWKDRALKAEAKLEKARKVVEAARPVVSGIDQWNADVQKIIWRAVDYSWGGLEELRAALAAYEAEEGEK